MPGQLRMIWPIPEPPPEVSIPEGYTLRFFQGGDEEQYINLLNSTGLGEWNRERLKTTIRENPLSPQGIFFVFWNGLLVATACALDRSGNHEGGKKKGELGWVGVHPVHRGKALGLVVCRAVLKYFIDFDYEEIFLLTDHWRYAAVKSYLKLGFEPWRESPADRFLWAELCQRLEWKLPGPKKARYIKKPTGEEIAWRTLELEPVKEPCIIASWCMKREFFQKLTHQDNIYRDAPRTTVEAYIRAGANLCPQFIMPSPKMEHRACNPFEVTKIWEEKKTAGEKDTPRTPEEVRDYIESLPEPHTLRKEFNLEIAGEAYAKPLLTLRDLARREMLFIGSFGQADFMGGYTRWGHENYLVALALYPEYLEKYFAYTAEMGRLRNVAIAQAVKKYKLAPFVYGGQDICFNDGPICSPETLDRLYFPHLSSAVEPLHEAGIKIIWHCDGDVRPIVDKLINQVGVAGFQGFQEETGCTLEQMARLRTGKGEKLILWGSLSVTTTLPFGTVEDVKNDVERCFRIAAPGGGFALASTSSILPKTPYENLIAMFEHGVRFGREFLSTRVRKS